MADWVEPGKKAPDFTLPADDGTKVKLSSLRGQPVVVYFYPRDDTPGCTREACALRDRRDELARLGAKVLGISPDDVESHGKFRDKFSLNFPLLADTGHEVAEKYGAWWSGRAPSSAGAVPSPTGARLALPPWTARREAGPALAGADGIPPS